MCNCSKDHLCDEAADLHRRHREAHLSENWPEKAKLRREYISHRRAARALGTTVEHRPIEVTVATDIVTSARLRGENGN